MSKLKDLTGQRFGKLVAVEFTGRKTNPGGNAIWLCKCDCGNCVEVRSSSLTASVRPQKSCGCAKMESAGLFSKTHGGSKERLYKVWMDMRRRCYDKTMRGYSQYGGRGISVCEEWKDYGAFREWAMENGYKPNAKYFECTIDRIDVDEDYGPNNCRWVDMKTQSNNKRNNKLIEYEGRSKTLRMWSEEFGVRYELLKDRIRRGWTLERAITQPLQIHGHSK